MREDETFYNSKDRWDWIYNADGVARLCRR